MNLWPNFDLKFDHFLTLFYKQKMAKISPKISLKINQIKIWPKSRQKVINS